MVSTVVYLAISYGPYGLDSKCSFKKIHLFEDCFLDSDTDTVREESVSNVVVNQYIHVNFHICIIIMQE